MRDGLQFWEKHGRKLQGIPSNNARSTWQQMTSQSKTMWGAKAKIHNKIEYAATSPTSLAFRSATFRCSPG